MSTEPLFGELFVFLEPGTNPAKERQTIEHAGGRTQLIWVPVAESAAKVASEAADGGTKLIELYRGFDLNQASQVIEAVVPRVPVGVASFVLGGAPAAGTKIRRSVTIYDVDLGDPAQARVTHEHEDGWTTVVGAPVDRMVETAKEFVDAGAELVEICGGTPLTAAAQVRAAVGDRAAVSLVGWSFESIDGAYAFKSAFAEAHKA